MSSTLCPPAAGDFQGALDGLLAFHIGQIEFVLVRLIEQSVQVNARRRDFHFAFKKTLGFPQILDGDDLKSIDDGRLGCIVLRDAQGDFAFGFGAQGDWQRPFDRPDSACWVITTARSKHRNPPNLYTFRDYGTTRPLLRPSENTSAKSGSTDLCP